MSCDELCGDTATTISDQVAIVWTVYSTTAVHLQALLGTLSSLTPQDFVNARGPPLPSPPQEVAADVVTCMQWRVQRIWTTLQIPPLQRLQMLATFVDKGFGEELVSVVEAWEDAVAAVAAREGILVQLAGVNITNLLETWVSLFVSYNSPQSKENSQPKL